jgi:hypothetical protein
VRNKDGTPARELRVSALAAVENGAPVASSMLAGLAQTDANGRFRLEAVPPGRYYITAGFLDTPTYYPGVSSIAEARVITITPGASVNGIDFQLARSAGVSVRGKISGAPAGALQGLLRVLLLPSGGARGGVAGGPVEVSVQPDGAFEFTKVSPGVYRIVSPAPAGSVTTITVGDSDVTGIEITAPPILLGRVTVDDGSKVPVQAAALAAGVPDPPAILRIQAQRDPGLAAGIVTVRGDGTFLLPNVSGEYRLAVTLLPVGYRVKSMTLGSVDLTQKNLQAPEPGSVNSAEIQVVLTRAPASGAPEGVTVSGKVMGLPTEGGLTPRWVSMQATSPAQGGNTVGVQRVGEAPLRADGTFEITGVPPGNYVMRTVGAGATGPATSVAVQDRDVTGVQLSLAPNPSFGGPAASVQQLLGLIPAPVVQPGVKISGKIDVGTNSASRPEGVALFGNSSERSQRVAIAADGTFEFPNVLPGAYSIATLPLGLLPEFSNIDVGARDMTGLRVIAPALSMVKGRTLPPKGGLSGVLRLRLQLADGYAWIETEPGGSFVRQLPHGEYRLTVEGVPAGLRVQSVRSGAVDLLDAPLRIDSAATPEIVITLAPIP